MTKANDIDQVITLLGPIIDGYVRQRSPLAYFPALYRVVTTHVRAKILEGNYFDDGPRMNMLDTAFANRYFAAYDECSANPGPARAWKAVFEAEKRRGVLMLQHLVLGMSAHINFDLPQSTAALGAEALPDVRADFERINKILADLLDRVQGVLDRFSPFIKLLDGFLGTADEAIANFSIDVAREEAWHEAERLATEQADLRPDSIRTLDRRVALLAKNIIVPEGIAGLTIKFVAATEQADVRRVTAAINDLAAP
jgi:hypothetical protein